MIRRLVKIVTHGILVHMIMSVIRRVKLMNTWILKLFHAKKFCLVN